MDTRRISRVTLVTVLFSYLNVQCNTLPLELNNVESNDKLKREKGYGFQLIAYLPHTDENTYCKGTINAINQNFRLNAIETIHLFRNSKSCIHYEDLPVSPKVVLHEVDENRNMTFADLMKFIVNECAEKNILLAKPNMLFQDNLDIYLKEKLEDGVVHVLKSIHPLHERRYDGTHYAFLFKGQWDKTKSSFQTVGMEFQLDSPRLDNENVMKKIFEVILNMNLKASYIRAYPICLH